MAALPLPLGKGKEGTAAGEADSGADLGDAAFASSETFESVVADLGDDAASDTALSNRGMGISTL